MRLFVVWFREAAQKQRLEVLNNPVLMRKLKEAARLKKMDKAEK